MSDRNRSVGLKEKRPHPVIWIVVAVAAVCAAVFLFLTVFAAENPFEPPVIQGVKTQIVINEDEDLQAALMDGVTAVGGADRPGQTFPVSVRIYQESGQEVRQCPPGTYRLLYSCQDGDGGEAAPVESTLIVNPVDREGPVIEGARDMTVEVGQEVSYRSGVTATDNVDQSVRLQVDAGQVNLTQPGEYPVHYSATDAQGNTTVVTITVTVVKAAEVENPDGDAPDETELPEKVSMEQLNELADKILGQITTAGMSQQEKAKAIYNYVNSHIRYVGTSDKSSWQMAAYVGFTQGRGDCYNYFACSKALLTRAGIPNVDLERTGGSTDHYWQLVDVGSGYYHFDACPHPSGYPITSFLLTEAEVRAYTEQCSSVRRNYYVYDYAACPVTAVAGTPAEEIPAVSTDPVELPEEFPELEPTPPVEQSPEPSPELPAEQSPEPTPEPPAEQSPEPTPEPPAVRSPEPTPELPAVQSPEPTPELPAEQEPGPADAPPSVSPATPEEVLPEQEAFDHSSAEPLE